MAINKDNIIPLAGMFQAGYLVYDIAQHGQHDNEAFETTIKSILNTDPESVLDVYGNDINNLSLGFDLLANIFSKQNKQAAIIIAHRISAVSNADEIMVLKRGQIVEKGKHEDLMINNAIYASMAKLQGFTN